MDDIFTKLIITSHSLLDISRKLQVPESLPVLSTKDSSVEEARKTLRWLRNLQFLRRDMEDWLRIGGIKEQQSKTEWLEKLVSVYAGQVKIAQLSNPPLLEHFTIDHANHACGSLALSTALHTLEILPDESPALPVLDKQLDNIMEEWEHRQGQSVEQLINAIESGITHLVNKPLGDRSPVDRLVEVSNNIQEAVRKLYSLETLNEPERIESIELAREILKRMKDLSFSDQTIAEAMESGLPTEQLAFAQRIAEMVDMYKNLLFDAMRVNPDIVNDARVKNANDAAYWCANGVKSAATKEMLNSITTAKLSDELSYKPTGNEFENSSINKLVNGMEGGMEHAADELATHKKNDKKTTVELEAEAQAAKVQIRRRRRKNQSAIAGHDVLQKANTPPQETMTISKDDSKNIGASLLNKLDIAAIQQAGSSLRKNNKQGTELASTSQKSTKDDKSLTANTTVSADTDIKPDNRGFSARERDPNNRNGPRIG